MVSLAGCVQMVYLLDYWHAVSRSFMCENCVKFSTLRSPKGNGTFLSHFSSLLCYHAHQREPQHCYHEATEVAAARLMPATNLHATAAPQPHAKMHRRDTAQKNLRNVTNCHHLAKTSKNSTRIAKLNNFEFCRSPPQFENKNVFNRVLVADPKCAYKETCQHAGFL